MGRYYSGDIEGKFWFAVQSSTDAEHFGGAAQDPNFITYYFGVDDKKDIEKGIFECLRALGSNRKKLNDYFKNKNSYSDPDIVKETGIKAEELPGILEQYARLRLGRKILKCVNDTGSCEFEAEL